jgi:Cupredoxin-like domain
MTKLMPAILSAWAFLAASPVTPGIGRAEAQELKLVIRNHIFEPAEIRVPPGKRIVLSISNEDPTPEEFDSSALKVEKVIPGKSRATLRIGPLDPGRYDFMGEFHADTAKGVLIAE